MRYSTGGSKTQRAKRITHGSTIFLGIVLCLVSGVVLLGEYASRQALQVRLTETLNSPSLTHWAGTDTYGRDVAWRVLAGAQRSLIVAIGATGVAMLIAALVSVATSMSTSRFQRVISWIIDGLLSIPRLVILLAFAAVMPRPSTLTLILIVGATGWMGTARFMSAQIERLQRQAWVVASAGLGISAMQRFRSHVLPDLAKTFFSLALLSVATALPMEAALSFLGFGLQPPSPSWGGMIQESREQGFQYWWMILAPVGALCVATLGLEYLRRSFTRRSEAV